MYKKQIALKTEIHFTYACDAPKNKMKKAGFASGKAETYGKVRDEVKHIDGNEEKCKYE